MSDPAIPVCTAADPAPRAPTFTMPDGACDCHAHVFGPLAQFPMVPDRLYTPPEAPLSAYSHLLTTLGFQRGVIVQPSVYGTDNRATLDAVATASDRFRAVVVVEPDVTAEQIEHFHAQGARGVRANLLFSGDRAMADIRRIANVIAPFGWHLQVLLDVSTFPDLFTFFDGLPVNTVFDHMGHLTAAKGVQDPGFQGMLRLLSKGKGWAKLSGAYRITGKSNTPYLDTTPLAQAILTANPEHTVFGTDWPHPHIPVAMPNDGDLLEQLADWAPDEATRHKVLVENPAQLYGF